MVADTTPLIGVREVCTYLGISRNTVYKMVKEGTLPAYKVGGKLRFKQEEIDGWLRKGVNQ